MQSPNLASDVIGHALKSKHIIVTAESCTGGLIGAALTDCPGASAAYHGGHIVYDNQAKIEFINVPSEILVQNGAVSEECAIAMCKGAISSYSKASLSIAVTGIAGPDGGSDEKPVGLVYIASHNTKTGQTIVEKHIFVGPRDAVRQQTVTSALDMLKKQMS